MTIVAFYTLRDAMTTAFRSPEILRVEELVRKVKDGDIKLPKFQRPFVWKRPDILNLWDSVYLGYPIGSVLLWLTKQKLAAEREIGDLDVSPRAEEYPTNYLLDGQQRLSSLCGVLYWPSSGDPKSIWNVAFDLREEKFFHPNEPLKSYQFPMHRLLETRDFIAQSTLFQSESDAAILNERAQRLLTSVKDYKIAAVILSDMELDKVGPVFERINSKGRRLTIADLMRAATWTRTFDFNDAFESISNEAKRAAYEVDSKSVWRNIAAATGKEITVGGIEKTRDVAESTLKNACIAVLNGYNLAIDFLRADIGVPSSYLLPYQLQLTLLVDFFIRQPSPSPNQRMVLRAWFWRTSFAGYFKGANTKLMTTVHQAMVKLAGGDDDDFLSLLPSAPPARMFEEIDFKLNTARGKAFALLLGTRAPVSLLDGGHIDVRVALAMANRVEYHHIFPKAFLATQGQVRQHALANICITNLIANRRISAKRPSTYLTDLSGTWGESEHDIKASNFLVDLPWGFALDDDYDSFLCYRALQLAEYATSQCRLPTSSTAPPSAI